jgi:hypothetical protein
MPKALGEVAKVLRSKNAGAFDITLDVFFWTSEAYRAFKRSELLTRETLARLYQIEPERIRSIHWHDEINAVKATIPRRLSCGRPGDTDVYGCQQYIPLWNLEVPDEVGGA